jgi:hypothetical protein
MGNVPDRISAPKANEMERNVVGLASMHRSSRFEFVNSH